MCSQREWHTSVLMISVMGVAQVGKCVMLARGAGCQQPRGPINWTNVDWRHNICCRSTDIGEDGREEDELGISTHRVWIRCADHFRTSDLMCDDGKTKPYA